MRSPRVQRACARAAIVFFTCAAFLTVAFGAAAQEKDLDEKLKEKDRELQRLRRSIAEQRKKVQDVEKREKTEAGYLRKLEEEERLTRELIAGLGGREALLNQQIEILDGELETNEKVYGHRLGVLAGRLREMYKDGPKQTWQELLDASDVADLVQRYKFVLLVAERDAALLSDVRQRRTQIQRQEAEITELLHEVSTSKREKETELELLSENERKRKDTLAKLKKERNRYQKEVEALAKAEGELQGIIEELEKRRLEQAKEWSSYGEVDFLRLRGTLINPVDGNIVRGFGQFRHPEFGTVTFNTGIDVEARRGSPVRAVARGKVEYASVLPGYGNCVILNHGGGYYSLYAHVSKMLVAQGDRVERGRVIAEVDGGEEAAIPFHFEIRNSKKALDPQEWLSR